MVRFRWTVPDWMSDSDWAELMTVEEQAGNALREARQMTRVWTVPGGREAIALFEVADATLLHELLSSLPLFPYLDITTEPLASHAMDSR